MVDSKECVTGKDWISPSEEDRKALEKTIRGVVFQVLKPIEEDDNYKESVVRILAALETVETLIKQANLSFQRKHKNHSRIHTYYIDKMQILADCMAALILRVDVDSLPECSNASCNIQSFALAASIIQAANCLDMTVDCELSSSGYRTAMKVINGE